jgi:hypothetical protein
VLVVRADTAYYGRNVIAAARRRKAGFSITARKDPAVTGAIAAIGEDAIRAKTAMHPRTDKVASANPGQSDADADADALLIQGFSQ